MIESEICKYLILILIRFKELAYQKRDEDAN